MRSLVIEVLYECIEGGLLDFSILRWHAVDERRGDLDVSFDLYRNKIAGPLQ